MFRRTLIFVVSAAVVAAVIPGVAAADTQFDDVPADHGFEREISWLAEQGTTLGCNPPANTLFCPDATVTRGQMAAFLSRALGLVSTGGAQFVDDDESIFEVDIERIAAAGITRGCNPPVNDHFCPDSTVSRGQMAAFIVRALDLDARSGERFVDDDGSVFESDIERIATAGITLGCNPPANDRYCPDRGVTRAQMAAFLYRALNSVPDIGPDIIPSTRRISWDPGVPGGLPDGSATVSVSDYGAVGDGYSDDSGAFQAAINSVSGSGGVVYVPGGTYRLNSTLSLGDGAVLRGAGPQATFLEFDLGWSSSPAIEMTTYDSGSWRGVTGGYQKGSTKVTLSDTSGISAPMYAEIQQMNDPDVMYTQWEWNVDWADNSVGEMVRIVAVSGNTVTLEKPLNISYRGELDPILRPHDLIERAGVERLNIRRIDGGDGNTISMTHAAHVWVSEVESSMTVRSHVAAAGTYGCEIRDSYFHDAHDYGGAGHGYGINLNFHATGCLVENNVFESLRHAMMVQVGANGNVFGYNYSVDSHDSSGLVLPDISIHGHYAFMNLFEGNVVDEVGIGDWWGPAGPGNTLLRNCVRTEGILIDDSSHQQNIVGNVLVGSPNTLQVDWSVDSLIAHGNYEGGSIRWDPEITIDTIRDSYYLKFAPNFHAGTEWPSIGPDDPGSCTNPARLRYESGSPVS